MHGQSCKYGGDDASSSSTALQKEGGGTGDEARVQAATQEQDQEPTQANSPGAGDTLREEPETMEQQRQQMQEEATQLYLHKREMALAHATLSRMEDDVNREIQTVDAFLMSKGVHAPTELPLPRDCSEVNSEWSQDAQLRELFPSPSKESQQAICSPKTNQISLALDATPSPQTAMATTPSPEPKQHNAPEANNLSALPTTLFEAGSTSLVVSKTGSAPAPASAVQSKPPAAIPSLPKSTAPSGPPNNPKPAAPPESVAPQSVEQSTHAAKATMPSPAVHSKPVARCPVAAYAAGPSSSEDQSTCTNPQCNQQAHASCDGADFERHLQSCGKHQARLVRRGRGEEAGDEALR